MTVLSTLAKEAKQTAEAGILIAVVLTGWKLQSVYQDIARSVYKDIKHASTFYLDTSSRLNARLSRSRFSKSMIHSTMTRWLANPKVQILIALCRYFVQFPLFVASLRVLMKCIAICAHDRKYRSSFMTFVAAYYAQSQYQMFQWRWTLFLLIRVAHSFSRWCVPLDLQPSILHVYPVIHGVCFVMLCSHWHYVPRKWWSLFENCLNVDRYTYKNLFDHRHGIFPPCSTVHEHQYRSCLVSFIADAFYRMPYILLFFFKFYAITNAINVPKWYKAIKQSKMKGFLWRMLTDCIGSFGFFLITSIGINSLCFSNWIMGLKNGSCSMQSTNKASLLCLNMMLGYLAIKCESPQRRILVALSCIWNIAQQLIRMWFRLNDCNASEKYEPTLSSKHFSAFLFAMTMMMAMFVYNSNPKLLKSMERMIIKKYFT